MWASFCVPASLYQSNELLADNCIIDPVLFLNKKATDYLAVICHSRSSLFVFAEKAHFRKHDFNSGSINIPLMFLIWREQDNKKGDPKAALIVNMKSDFIGTDPG
jgi:hypothetical protein